MPNSSPDHAARALLAVDFSAADGTSLRAYALAVPTREFEHAFAAAVDRLGLRPGPATPQGMFLACLLERLHWGNEDWLRRLAGAWQDCLCEGNPPTLAASACLCLVEAVRDSLCVGDSPFGRPEQDILAAATKLMLALQAMFAAASQEPLRPAPPGGDVEPVTGLPTRAHFLQQIRHHMAQANNRPLGLLIMHVDWGPGGPQQLSAQRDRMRRVLSDAMCRVLRAEDVLCSVADQEWALIMPGLRSTGQVQLAARRLIEICERSPGHNFPQLRGAIHAGTACAPDDGDDSHMLEHAARAALHRAIRADVPVVCFHADMIAALEREIRLERDIVRTAANPPFHVWLQPQIELCSGRCAGAEALLRWQNDGEWIPPQQVVEIAGRLGLMPGLSRWLLSQVVRLIASLDEAGIDVPVSLNLVAQDLHDEDLAPLVAQTLATWRVPASRLVLEITEGALIGDRTRAAQVIQQLRALGCGVSLDDFGTGFSSFAYMRDLPVSELKIDQLFVRDMLHSGRDHAIVETVQALAHGFGMKVVAEGVEDQATADELQRMGCDHAQGFLYARAMPPTDFIRWIRERNQL